MKPGVVKVKVKSDFMLFLVKTGFSSKYRDVRWKIWRQMCCKVGEEWQMWDHVEYHAITFKIMQYHGIPWNTLECILCSFAAWLNPSLLWPPCQPLDHYLPFLSQLALFYDFSEKLFFDSCVSCKQQNTFHGMAQFSVV